MKGKESISAGIHHDQYLNVQFYIVDFLINYIKHCHPY